MKQLPIKKQFQIMDLIRNKISIRDIQKLLLVAKSTVQDYKKYGPPFFRKNSKNPPVELYPASVQEENKWLRQAFEEILQTSQQAINQRNTANKTIYYLTQGNNQKDREMESQKHKNEQLIKQVSERDKTIQDLTLSNNRLDDKNKKLQSEDDQKNQYIADIKKELQKYKTELVQTNESLILSNKKIKQITEENDKYKNEVRRLTMEHENDFMKNVVVGIGCFGLGMVVDQIFIGRTSHSPLPPSAEGTNTGIGYFQKPQAGTISSIYGIDNGKNQEINTSGSPSLGADFNNIGGNTDIRYDAILDQQDGVIPGTQGIESGMTLETNVSGILCSGVFSNNYGKSTGTGYTVFPIQQDLVIQPDIRDISSGGHPRNKYFRQLMFRSIL